MLARPLLEPSRTDADDELHETVIDVTMVMSEVSWPLDAINGAEIKVAEARGVTVLNKSMLLPAIEDVIAENRSQSMTGLQHRRSLKSTCRDVRTSYTSNCHCVQRILGPSCAVECKTRYSTFVPVRISVGKKAEGFVARNDGSVATLAQEAYSSLTRRRLQPLAQPSAQTDQADAPDAAKYAGEQTDTYSPYVDQPRAVARVAPDPWAVVLTTTRDFTNRQDAMNYISGWQFAPGAISSCYIDPKYTSRVWSGFLPKTMLAFSWEMGYGFGTLVVFPMFLLYWLFTLALVFVNEWLGGEAVVGSYTVMTDEVAYGC